MASGLVSAFTIYPDGGDGWEGRDERDWGVVIRGPVASV
jgi:hypothetical protein